MWGVYVGIISQADISRDSIPQYLRILIHIVDIIDYREVLVDMLLYFKLSKGFALIIFLKNT